MKTFVTLALMGAGLATAGLMMTGNEAGGACPIQAAASGACCPASGDCADGASACPVDLTQKKATASYAVAGLSSEESAAKLTGVLGKVKGVEQSSACTESGLTKVSYDPATVKKEQLLAAIQNAGFKLEGEVVELKVQGMDCAGCTGSVSEALTAVQGVKTQKVCTESKVATVTFDPLKTNREVIVAAIDKTGFKVVP